MVRVTYFLEAIPLSPELFIKVTTPSLLLIGALCVTSRRRDTYGSVSGLRVPFLGSEIERENRFTTAIGSLIFMFMEI